MIKHPTLTPEQIEEIQRWCFEEDFQRLGPSIYRVLEARLLGYQKLRRSPNPVLRRKAEYYASELRVAYPVFLAGRLLGPNAAVRRWIGDLQRGIHTELGRPTMGERAKSVLAVGAALWTALTLKMDWFQHPKLIRTTYRLPEKKWDAFHLWEGFPARAASPHFSIQVELQHVKQQVWMRLEGALSAVDADELGRRIRDILSRSRNHLILDLNKLDWHKINHLQPLREKLAEYRSRIRLVLPALEPAHPEIALLAGIFEPYRS